MCESFARGTGEIVHRALMCSRPGIDKARWLVKYCSVATVSRELGSSSIEAGGGVGLPMRAALGWLLASTVLQAAAFATAADRPHLRVPAASAPASILMKVNVGDQVIAGNDWNSSSPSYGIVRAQSYELSEFIIREW